MTNSTSQAERVAVTVDRLATLLTAGSPPALAWTVVASYAARDSRERPRPRLLARLRGTPAGDDVQEVGGSRGGRWRVPEANRSRRPTGPSRVETAVARALRDGRGVAEVLRDEQCETWRTLGCAWELAERGGGPLAASLTALASGFRDDAAARRDIETALAAPRATAGLVMALPLVGLLLCAAIGPDGLLLLVTTPLGGALLGAAVALLLLARVWNRALIARATPGAERPGLALDLVALVLRGGGAPEDARSRVARALERFRLVSDLEACDDVLGLAAAAGVPAARLLRGEAALARRRARAEAERRAATLSVLLVLPLGVCVLPAFVAVGVVPLIASIIGGTVFVP